MRNLTTHLVIAVAVAVSLGAAHARADVILASGFNAHGSADGAASFTGIVWGTTNGVSNPGGTIALSSGATVQTSGLATNVHRLAVDRNIDTAGPWTINITFTALTAGITLSDLTFGYQFINATGAAQVSAHPGSGVVDVSILNAALATLSTVQIGPLGTSDAASNSGIGIIADFADVALTNGQTYTLRFTAGSNVTVGNHMAVDNFALNGTIAVVPAPAAAPAMVALLAALAVRRRR